MTDDALELLRSQSGLAIDGEGRFLHRGEPITHARTLAVLWGSLEPTPEGRWLVRIGRESGYVSIEVAPYVVRGVLERGGAPWLLLSDGTEEALDPRTLALGQDGVLRCAVKAGRPASFSRGAQVTLGLALEERPPGSGRYELAVGGVRYPVAAP